METPDFLVALEKSFEDERLSDDERRSLGEALRGARPLEENLRRVRNHAFTIANTRLSASPDARTVLKWLEGVMRAIDGARAPARETSCAAYFSPGQDCLHAITQRLRAARSRVDICVFTISDDRISAEILAAHQRKVAVRIITDNEKELDTGSDIDRLRRAGIPVRVDRTAAHMHHKFALFDGQYLLSGSYNWTRSACDLNEENLLMTTEPKLHAAFAEQFEALWTSLGS
jgi:phosphatidylserine/phosphatidylglycerophosphate/cardiolipin synthase-like enzyme